jgi:starvation-inducible DNA-binding protein
MDSLTNSIYLPPLAEPHEREGTSRELEAVLHELINLALIGKQLHWAVVGPWSRPLHLHLDELVASWRDLADTVAERAAALGFVPDGQLQAVAAGSQLTPVPQGPVEDHVVVRELTRRVAEVSERVRARLEPIGQVDLASQDVLIDVVRELEKQQWLLRVQLGEHV